MLSNEESQRQMARSLSRQSGAVPESLAAEIRGAADGRELTRQAFLMRGAGGLVAFSSLSAVLAACGSGSSTTGTAGGAGTAGSRPARPTGTLTFAMAGFPVSLDPTVDGAISTISVCAQVYEGLTGFDPEYRQLVGVLATRWETSPDARTWTFTLREGVRFHDGTKLDATAARKSIEYTLRRTSTFGVLLGAPTLDDSTPGKLIFRYRDPFPDCARNLTYVGPIFSPKLLAGSTADAEKRVAKQHAGTGPFQFASVKDGESIELTAFDGYWGEKAGVARLDFRNVPDESARNSALAAGDVNLIVQVAPLPAQSMRANSNLAVQSKPTWTTVCLSPVYTMKPFTDLRVRQAVLHALDRRTLVDKLLLGQAQVDDSMLPQGVYGYVVADTTYAYDPSKARALLKEAGYDGSPLRMAARADAVLASEISQALAGQLNAAGFKVTAEVLDPAAYEADINGPNPRYQIHWNEYGWVTGGPFHLTLGDIAARGKYSTPAYDKLVAKVQSTPDGPAREAVIKQAVELWARDAAWATLWVPNRIDVASASVQGYRTPPNVITLLGNAYLNGAA